ncbi:MAG TPA: hypothetical protein VF257_00410 [Solirubrobacteraceae bacterium]
MTSLIRLFFPSFEPPATTESADPAPVSTPEIEDLEAYAKDIREIQQRSADRRAAAGAA